MDRLFNGAFVMGHDDGLAAVAAHLDHATYVIVAGVLTDGVSKVQIDPPDMVTVAVKCGTDQSSHSCERLLATFDVCICPDLNQHCLARPYNESAATGLFGSLPLEEALVRGFLSYIRGLALFRPIYVRVLQRLA
jgi:hypothetical protein